MRCLIDADVLVYEIGYASQWVGEDGEMQYLSAEKVEENLAQKIKEIEEECWADEESTLYLTINTWLKDNIHKYIDTPEVDSPGYSDNFRVELAKTKPYKGTRKEDKPFHYYNILSIMLSNYTVIISDGMEADDEMSIEQVYSEPLTTIICTRDKDLRMIPGMHFGWECGKQPQFGPVEVDKVGGISLTKQGIKGTGMAFFYSQLVTGDAVDNIPGLPRGGPAMAFKLLGSLSDADEMFSAVVTAYKDKMGDDWKEYLTEQAQLLWMIRGYDNWGIPQQWEMPDGYED